MAAAARDGRLGVAVNLLLFGEIAHRGNTDSWQRQACETYDRGNGATILLYNRER
jgi:hypothetical protein